MGFTSVLASKTFFCTFLLQLSSSAVSGFRAPILSNVVLPGSLQFEFSAFGADIKVSHISPILLLIAIEVIDFLLCVTSAYLLVNLSIKQGRFLRTRILKRALLFMGRGVDRELQDLPVHLRSYVDAVERFIKFSLIPAIASLFSLIFIILISSFINPAIALLLAAKSLCLLLISAIYSRLSARFLSIALESSDTFSRNTVLSRAAGISILFGGLSSLWYRRRLHENRIATNDRKRWSHLDGIYISFIGFYTGLFIIFGWLVLNLFYPSNSADFLTFVFYAGSLMSPVTKLASFIPEYRETQISIRNIGDLNISIENNVKYNAPISGIKFKAPFSKHIYKHDVQLKSGDRVALLGPSGSGKTATIEALLGIRKPVGSSLEMNGVTIEGMTNTLYRNGICFSNDRPVFENGTILFNADCSQKRFKEISEDFEIFPITDTIYLDAFTKRNISRDGTPLSLGERQRLNILRILAKNPRILILDEALSGVDEASEYRIVEKIIKKTEISMFVYTGHRTHIHSLFERKIFF